MYCSRCNQLMNRVMEFTPDGKMAQFYRCPICYYESKRKRLILEEEEVNQENKIKKEKKTTQKKKSKPKKKVRR